MTTVRIERVNSKQFKRGRMAETEEIIIEEDFAAEAEANSRLAKWFITINMPGFADEPEEDLVNALSGNAPAYFATSLTKDMPNLIYTEVVAERGDCFHFHVIAHYKKSMRFNKVKLQWTKAAEALFPGCGLVSPNLQGQKGTNAQAHKYVNKKDKTYILGPWKWGTMKNEKSNKRDQIVAMIHEGTALIDMLTHTSLGAFACKNIKWIKDSIAELTLPVPVPLRQSWWFHGKTGTGKSFAARRMLLGFADVTAASIVSIGMPRGKTAMSFDQYDPIKHNAVILDDFRPDSINFNNLLNMLDVYGAGLDSRYQHVPWNVRYIVITSPLDPRTSYAGSTGGEDIEQLLRRLHRNHLGKDNGIVGFKVRYATPPDAGGAAGSLQAAPVWLIPQEGQVGAGEQGLGESEDEELQGIIIPATPRPQAPTQESLGLLASDDEIPPTELYTSEDLDDPEVIEISSESDSDISDFQAAQLHEEVPAWSQEASPEEEHVAAPSGIPDDDELDDLLASPPLPKRRCSTTNYFLF